MLPMMTTHFESCTCSTVHVVYRAWGQWATCFKPVTPVFSILCHNCQSSIYALNVCFCTENVASEELSVSLMLWFLFCLSLCCYSPDVSLEVMFEYLEIYRLYHLLMTVKWFSFVQQSWSCETVSYTQQTLQMHCSALCVYSIYWKCSYYILSQNFWFLYLLKEPYRCLA